MSSTDSSLGFISAGVADDTASLLESLNRIKQRQILFHTMSKRRLVKIAHSRS